MMGDQGVVLLRFRIMRDGSVISEEPVLERSSSKVPLDNAAMGSIRASSPFEPLPPAAAALAPCIEYIFMYCYNCIALRRKVKLTRNQVLGLILLGFLALLVFLMRYGKLF